MRLTILIVVCLLQAAAIGIARCQTPRSAASYGKSLGTMQVRLLKKNLRYIVKISKGEPSEKVEARRLALVAETEAIRSELQKLPDFNGDDELKMTTLRICQSMLAAYATNYRQLIELDEGAKKSFESLQRFSRVQNTAQLRLTQQADSLLAAQERFADQYGGNPNSYADLRRWVEATQMVRDLVYYEFQVLLPFARVQWAFEPLPAAFLARDAAGVEAARLNLATAAAQSTAELDSVPEFKNLEVAFRDAVREFVKLQTTACTYHLVEIAGLMKRQGQLSADEANTISTYLSAYNTENQRLVQIIARANNTLLRTYSSKINEELAK